MDSDSNDSKENNGDVKTCANNARRKLAMRKNIGKSNYANDVNDDSEEKNKGAKKTALKKKRANINNYIDIDEESDGKEDEKRGKGKIKWQGRKG